MEGERDKAWKPLCGSTSVAVVKQSLLKGIPYWQVYFLFSISLVTLSQGANLVQGLLRPPGPENRQNKRCQGCRQPTPAGTIRRVLPSLPDELFERFDVPGDGGAGVLRRFVLEGHIA